MREIRRGLSRCSLRTKREDSGFTLVELLVVMLILGILAAIAIPAFFSQADKAKNTDAQSTANTARKAVMARLTEKNDFSTIATADLIAIEPTLGSVDGFFAVPLAGDSFAVVVGSKTGTFFGYLFDSSRNASKVCLPAGSSGCSSSSTW